MTSQGAFLDVSTSLTGRRWVGPDPARDRAALMLAQQLGLPPLLCAVLARQGIGTEEAADYLEPKLRDLMPDPSSLKDMDTAVLAFLETLDRGTKIAVFADYDVDGATSAALLVNWLAARGAEATVYVPDRIEEGYGPNVPAMEALAQDHGLIICVDCGTVAFEPIEAARKKGTRVLVIDHHQGAETLPAADGVVNPNRQDEDSPLTTLCAAGLVFLFLVAVNRALRGRGEAPPDLMGALDLVALGTVADVARLTGLNRAFVRQGLRVMAGRGRPGLRALADVAGMTSAPSPYHLGYLLGPRINAGGRIGRASLGVELLTTQDAAVADARAEELNRLNGERRDIEAQVLAEAKAQAEARGLDRALVWASGDGWHPGVVGIVASRLKDFAGRPAVVLGTGAGQALGSGRSVGGIDLGRAVAQCAREGLLLKGGGHAMAAGLTAEPAKIERAMERLEALLADQGADRLGPGDLKVLGALEPSGATVELVEQLEAAGPYGAGNPAPRVALPAARIAYCKPVGVNHLSFSLKGAMGAVLQGVAFGAMDTGLGPALMTHGGAAFHLAGRLEIDDYGGRRRVKLHLEDAAPV